MTPPGFYDPDYEEERHFRSQGRRSRYDDDDAQEASVWTQRDLDDAALRREKEDIGTREPL